MYAFDRRSRDRTHITAQKSHGARIEAMAARATHETRADEACARSPFVRSIAVVGNRTSLLLPFFHPLQPWFECKDLQHHKTLKQAKTLNNNKAKGLTNIN
jgi:hypothetical protein